MKTLERLKKFTLTKWSGKERRRYKVLAHAEINGLSWEYDNEEKRYSSISFDINTGLNEKYVVKLERATLEYLLERLNEPKG